MSTETLGIAFTVLLVDRLMERHEHQEDRSREVRSLRKANVVLSMYIDRFQLYACEVVTPDKLNPEGGPLPTHCPESWEFRDMRKLFKPSMLMVGDRSPAVLCCLKALRELQRFTEVILIQQSFEHFPNIAKTLVELVQTIGFTDLYDGINMDFHSALGSEKVTAVVERMIAQHDGPVEYIPSHVLTRYIVLYFRLKKAIELLKQYEEEFANATGQHRPQGPERSISRGECEPNPA